MVMSGCLRELEAESLERQNTTARYRILNYSKPELNKADGHLSFHPPLISTQVSQSLDPRKGNIRNTPERNPRTLTTTLEESIFPSCFTSLSRDNRSRPTRQDPTPTSTTKSRDSRQPRNRRQWRQYPTKSSSKPSPTTDPTSRTRDSSDEFTEFLDGG